MKVWNNCDLLSDALSLTEDEEKAYDIYRSQLKMQIENVWYDKETKECFGLDYNYTNRPDLAGVLTPKRRFHHSPRWGKEYVSTTHNTIFNSELEVTGEMIVVNPELLKRFEGKTILIVGAGPSAKEYEWEEEEYDSIWTCNHFFKFDRLLKRDDISLVSLGNEVDLTKSNNVLHSYMKGNDDTLFAFDCGVTRPFMHMHSFNDAYFGRGLCYHPRFFGKVGTMARMICLAIHAKVGKIKFIGMDGVSREGPNVNVFEPGKAFTGPSRYNLFNQQYVMFWDYVLNTLNPNIEFENLGEFHLSNLTADISKQEFETHNKRVIENV